MRTRSGRATLAIVVALLAGLAAFGSGAPAETAQTGNPMVFADANFAPRTLDRTQFTPGTLLLSTHFETLDGSHVPPLKELVWEFDRNTRLDVSGLPACPRPRIRVTDLPGPEKQCTKGIVGRGRMQVEILFEESDIIRADVPLTVYNSGVRNGVPTLFARAFITKPVPSAITIEIRLNPINSGRFRTAMVVNIPKIAGGAGSVTGWNMWLRRSVRDHDRIVSLVSLRCLDRRLATSATATFGDGTRLQGGMVRPCSAR